MDGETRKHDWEVREVSVFADQTESREESLFCLCVLLGLAMTLGAILLSA